MAWILSCPASRRVEISKDIQQGEEEEEEKKGLLVPLHRVSMSNVFQQGQRWLLNTITENIKLNRNIEYRES